MLITVSCSCGCGITLQREQGTLRRFPRPFVQGHQFRGALNVNWKGGKRCSNGYCLILNPTHPNADKKGYVREHVLVMSTVLQRKIEPFEVVHHINGITNDNRPENLAIMTRPAHAAHHHTGLIKPNSLKALRGKTSEEMRHIWNTTLKHRRAFHICPHCTKQFHRRGKAKFCSYACRGQHTRSLRA